MKITEKTIVAMPMALVITCLLAVVAGVFVAATAFASINYRLDSIVTRDEFHKWEGQLRRDNEHLHLNVPTFERQSQSSKSPNQDPLKLTDITISRKD